jgi:hypothetical protein
MENIIARYQELVTYSHFDPYWGTQQS